MHGDLRNGVLGLASYGHVPFLPSSFPPSPQSGVIECSLKRVGRHGFSRAQGVWGHSVDLKSLLSRAAAFSLMSKLLRSLTHSAARPLISPLLSLLSSFLSIDSSVCHCGDWRDPPPSPSRAQSYRLSTLSLPTICIPFFFFFFFLLRRSRPWPFPLFLSGMSGTGESSKKKKKKTSIEGRRGARDLKERKERPGGRKVVLVFLLLFTIYYGRT